MRKVMISMIFIGLMSLVACNTSADTQKEDDMDNETMQGDEKEKNENEEDTNPSEGDINLETDSSDEPESTDENETNEGTEEKENESSAENAVKDDVDDETEVIDIEEKLKDFGYDIFQAQNEEDYDFLDSILAEGASMDKEAKMFYFENVTYPHEQEFIKAKKSDIEYRYIHEEDEETMIVGFAVVDYEAEFSFTIDFEFVQEDGKWKMKDMDMNA